MTRSRTSSAVDGNPGNDRRGVIEVQFSWIFVLIAGAVFLILFLSIAKSQKTQTDVTIDAELLTKLDSLILGSTSSFSSFKSISIPRVDLNVGCDEGGLSSLSIGNGATIPTPVQAIYSRPLLRTSDLFIFTDAYATPYPVAPVLYLSSPTIRYIFINETPSGSDPNGNDNTMERIHSLFPENVTEMIKDNDITMLREITDETIFISLGSQPFCNPGSFTPSKTRFVHITPDPALDARTGSGMVEICRASPSGCASCTTLGYSGDAMLKGAIVSADPITYACNTQKLLHRQEILASLAAYRADLYLASGNLSTDCSTAYNGVKTVLPNLQAPVDFSNPTNVYPAMQLITQSANQLAVQNDALIRGTKCPLLY